MYAILFVGMISNVSDLSPPWLALEHQVEEMLASPCILPGRIIKGGPKHTGVRTVREYLRHWFFTLGYIEFIQFKDGTIQPPVPSPWWTSADVSLTSWHEGRSTEVSSVPESRSSGHYCTAFGSSGLRLTLPEVIRRDSQDIPAPEFAKLADPADSYLNHLIDYNPAEPAWPAPAICPQAPYPRGQWVTYHLKQLPCELADALSSSTLLLVQLPVRHWIFRLIVCVDR